MILRDICFFVGKFHKIVIKQVVVELKRCKEAVMARINYLDNLSDQVIKKQAVLQEKTADKNKKVTELENSVNELVRIVTEQLTDIREDEPEIGTIPYTLAVLEEFLNQQVITLPKIIDGTRAN